MIKHGIRIESLGNAWMGVEVVGAMIAGILAGSLALVAFGADSSVELLSGVVVFRHLSVDDQGSPISGHRTALLTSGLLFALIPAIGGIGFYSYISGIRPEGSSLGIALALGAVLIMPFLFFEKRRIGRDTRCLPLSIDAYASATCFLMSIALLGGLITVYLTGLWWIDYLATVAIVAFVVKEAVESFREVSVQRQSAL
jgi:divalent metal cation (Fe/Co/Zn/Cd) transporter